jgi:hypothetical protein
MVAHVTQGEASDGNHLLLTQLLAGNRGREDGGRSVLRPKVHAARASPGAFRHTVVVVLAQAATVKHGSSILGSVVCGLHRLQHTRNRGRSSNRDTVDGLRLVTFAHFSTRTSTSSTGSRIHDLAH